jgi:hypothetical protein
MNIDQKLEHLKQIQEVDAPDFLFTRIKQQIQNRNMAKAPVQWKWAFAGLGIVILALNASLLFKPVNNKQNQAEIETYINALHLTNSNNLYHE